MRRIANLVVLEKCCKMRIWVQKSASMQKRTSPLKFGDLAEKSELNSVSDFFTKAPPPVAAAYPAGAEASTPALPKIRSHRHSRSTEILLFVFS